MAEMMTGGRGRGEGVRVLQNSGVIPATLPHFLLLRVHASALIIILFYFFSFDLFNSLFYLLLFSTSIELEANPQNRTGLGKSFCKPTMTEGNLIFSCQRWNICQLYANRSCVFRIICISG